MMTYPPHTRAHRTGGRRTRGSSSLLLFACWFSAYAAGTECSSQDPVNRNPIAQPIPKDEVATLFTLQATSGKGLESPNWGIAAPGDRRHLFVTDTVGTLWAVHLRKGTKNPVLDLSPGGLNRLVPLDGYDERGLLGVAFHPKYPRNGLLYTYTSEPYDPQQPADFPLRGLAGAQTPNHTSVVAEWRVADPGAARPVVDPASRRVLLRIDQPQFNHNGGALNFGKDGRLYIALGDGGGSDDEGAGHHPEIGNGQDRSTVLGKILRINPRGSGSSNGQYGIPGNNPYAQPGPRGGDAGCADGLCDEIWAYGFRNPYRFSFDAETGDLYVADVGQNKIEEVNRVERGGNYGWRYKEGSFFFQPNGADPGFVSDRNCLSIPDSGLIDPIAEYDHDEGSAVVGGFVYRGKAIPALAGHYIFADYYGGSPPSARLFRIDVSGSAAPHEIREFERFAGSRILGFGQGTDRELFLLGNASGLPAPPGGLKNSGSVLKLLPIPAPGD